MLEYKTLRKYYEDAIHLKIALQMSRCNKKDICEALAPIKKKIRTMYKLDNIKYGSVTTNGCTSCYSIIVNRAKETRR